MSQYQKENPSPDTCHTCGLNYVAILNWWRKKFNNQMPKIWNTKPNKITKYVRVCDQIHGAQSKHIKAMTKIHRAQTPIHENISKKNLGH